MGELQKLMDSLMDQWRRERSESQMTLGELISALKVMPPEIQVANLCGAHSYRGYYSDLSFERLAGTRPAKNLLADCLAALGNEFTGYKGGEFLMKKDTPVWVASYGCCGLKLMGIDAHGQIQTAEDD